MIFASDMSTRRNALTTFRWCLVATQTATIGITWPLWQVRPEPPNLPLVDLPQFSPGWWLVASLALVLARPAWGIALHWGLLVLAMLLDQTRIQPQMFSQAILLAATLPYAGAQLLGRVYLITLWFYAALHKLASAGYWDDVAPWFLHGFFPDAPRSAILVFGAIMATYELMLAVLSIVPRTRKLAAAAIAVFHLGVFVTLSPLAMNWNPSVWPWNVALGLAGWALILPWQTTLAGDLRASPVGVRLATAVMLVAPLGYYVGLVDPYLAHCLYAGNTPKAVLSRDGESEEVRFLPVVNVPLPPAHRVFEQFFAAVAEPGDSLTISDPRWFARRQGWHDRTITPSGEARSGKRHGLWTHRHKNGQPHSQGEYVDGEEEGPWTFWTPDGKKEASGVFHAGQEEGLWTYWYDDGPAMQVEYRAGEMVGQPRRLPPAASPQR